MFLIFLIALIRTYRIRGKFADWLKYQGEIFVIAISLFAGALCVSAVTAIDVYAPQYISIRRVFVWAGFAALMVFLASISFTSISAIVRKAAPPEIAGKLKVTAIVMPIVLVCILIFVFIIP